MTGVDKDLATLRRYVFNDKALPALARVEAELSRLEEERRHLSVNESAYYDQWKAAEAELSRLREERDVYVEDVNAAQARAEAAESDLQHQSERRSYWRDRAEAAEARCARLQQALAKADKAASKAHDAMWAMDFDKTSASSSERDAWKRLREQASDAIWAIHNLLRPLMAREALAGPDTPAEEEA